MEANEQLKKLKDLLVDMNNSLSECSQTARVEEKDDTDKFDNARGRLEKIILLGEEIRRLQEKKSNENIDCSRK
ncbi:hypothetical protein BDQ17DRAFT_599972 [Cyathus striatus]|nr:hypothetical protein BDQ17DRAFT_599972 [Cyathus striatus]